MSLRRRSAAPRDAARRGALPHAQVRARQQRGQHHRQQCRAAGVRHRRHQRPAEHHVGQAGGQLPDADRGQAHGEAVQCGVAAGMQPPRQCREGGQHDHCGDAVHDMDRRQRLKGQIAAAGSDAELAANRECVGEVHRRRPPLALAGGKVAAGQHRVIGADPTTERDLHHRQCGDGPGCRRETARQHQRARREHLVLHRQQRQQADATEQVQRDDGRVQLHRHRERAEGALRDDPGQRQRCPPRGRRAAFAAATQPPAGCRHHGDQHADRGGQVAVDHFDPGLAVRDRAARLRALRRRDLLARAERAGAAVAAGPVGTTQARIGEPREGAEQHQVEGQEQRQQRQRMQPPRRRRAAVAQPQPGQRAERDHRSQQRHARQRGPVDQRHIDLRPAPGRSQAA